VYSIGRVRRGRHKAWTISRASVLSRLQTVHIAGCFHHSLYTYTFFAFNVDSVHRLYRGYAFVLNHCLASRYRFSASLKLMTFQMALR